jgi:hypothetical protein
MGHMQLQVVGRNFLVCKFAISSTDDANNAYQSLLRCINIRSIRNLYAFSLVKPWSSWDPNEEYQRQECGEAWRMTTLNEKYDYSPTYCHQLMVPTSISDAVLQHAVKYRSKGRIPILSYSHPGNHITISRSSQPLAGLQAKRSYQDEFLVQAIFATGNIQPGVVNLIVDARPTVNAMAMSVAGAGAESMENYPNCKLSFLGIDNIHVVRDSWNRLLDTITNVPTPIPIRLLDKSGWLKHIRNILDGTFLIVQGVHLNNQHVLVHCSDGWDRTSQLCTLAMLCLDPFYRTMKGFSVLVEKEWVSVGHKFAQRTGILSRDLQEKSEDPDAPPDFISASIKSQFAQAAKSGMSFLRSNLGTPTKGDVVHSSLQNTDKAKEASPIFTQFLDCVHQLMVQYPQQFEFNDNYLVQLNTFLYSNHFGNFLFNSEKERREWRSEHGECVENVTSSVWDWFEQHSESFLNDCYEAGERVIYPSTRDLEYWKGWLFRSDRRLDGIEQLDVGGSDDDLLSSTASLAPTPPILAPSPTPKESGMDSVKNAFAAVLEFNPWSNNGSGLSGMDSLKAALPQPKPVVKLDDKPLLEDKPVVKLREEKPKMEEKPKEGLFSNLFTRETPGTTPIDTNAAQLLTKSVAQPIIAPKQEIVTKSPPKRDGWHPLLDE